MFCFDFSLFRSKNDQSLVYSYCSLYDFQYYLVLCVSSVAYISKLRRSFTTNDSIFERFRSRAFQRAPKYSQRISIEKVIQL